MSTQSKREIRLPIEMISIEEQRKTMSTYDNEDSRDTLNRTERGEIGMGGMGERGLSHTAANRRKAGEGEGNN